MSSTSNNTVKLCYSLLLYLAVALAAGENNGLSFFRGRNLKEAFESLSGSCPHGVSETESEDTELNQPDYWETVWGRSGDSWPRRGFSECWSNRGSVCALPDEDHTVCLPGSRRGSVANAGWALNPDSQTCQPGVFCLYACEPGYYWTQFNQEETSNFDVNNAPQKGNCDGTWNYGTSTQGLYCDNDGVIKKVYPGPICKLGETYVFAENRLDTHVFVCQSVYPGNELFSIPTLIKSGESVMLTTQPKSFWTGPSTSKPTHGDFYASFAGADIMEACVRDGVSPSGTAMLPYEIGTGVEDNGFIYSTHYLYQQPNSEIPSSQVGYEIDLACESREKGVCGSIIYNGGMIKVDVLKKPRSQSTKVKFVFRKPVTTNETIYKEPAAPTYQEPVASEPSQTSSQETSTPSSNYGRKLKYAESTESKAFLQNSLPQPIIVCEEMADAAFNRISVSPGEFIQIKEKKSYYLRKKTTGVVDCDTTKMPWLLSPGVEFGSGTFQYSYSMNLKTTKSSNRVDYGVFLKCTGEEEVCYLVDAKSVEVEKGASNVYVTYTIKPFRAEAEPRLAAYDWGRFLFGWKH